jgi:hypothetical protein
MDACHVQARNTRECMQIRQRELAMAEAATAESTRRPAESAKTATETIDCADHRDPCR